MRLFIAEKPSMAKDIALALDPKARRGNGYIQAGQDRVTWCFGHMLEMFEPEDYDPALKKWTLDSLPIVPSQWRRKVKTTAQEQIAVIRASLAWCQQVVHAGDPDQEGQLIVDALLAYLANTKPVQRLWAQSLDKVSLKRALANLADNTLPVYRGLHDSAEARTRADWLIGFTCSRLYTLLWQQTGHAGLLPVGRVQTPTLGLVVQRDRAREAFVPTPYADFSLVLVHGSGQSFKAKFHPPKDAPYLSADGLLTDQAVAKQVMADIKAVQHVEVTAFAKERKVVAAPKPYSLDRLQRHAYRQYGYDANKTLEIAQALYQVHKLISYPRVDTEYLPNNQHADAPAVGAAALANLGIDAASLPDLDWSRRAACWNDKKVTAHHAIIPTVTLSSGLTLTRDETNLYTLIARAYLAQFLPDYEYDATRMLSTANEWPFASFGAMPVVTGWKAIIPTAAQNAKDREGDVEALLPAMYEGEHIKIADRKQEAKVTTAPDRFNPDTLVAAMREIGKYVQNPKVRDLVKEDGIGTNATRSTIIAELVRRELLEEVASGAKAKGNKKRIEYVSSGKARALYDVLPDILRQPDLTAVYEQVLQRIRDGTATPAQLEARAVQVLQAVTQEVNSGAGLENLRACEFQRVQTTACKACGGTMRKNRLRWTCSDCGAKAWDMDGVPYYLKEEQCPSCGEALLLQKSQYGFFVSCSGFKAGCRYKSNLPAQGAT